MDLKTLWAAKDWEAQKPAPLFEKRLKTSPGTTMDKLLCQYRKLLKVSWALTLLTPLAFLLRLADGGFAVTVCLVWSYSIALSAYLSVKFLRFKRPDLSKPTGEAIRHTLAFVKSIGEMQGELVAFFVPFVFLGSFLGKLLHNGRSLAGIFTDPLPLAVTGLSVAAALALRRPLVRLVAGRQCKGLIAQLEENLAALEGAKGF